MIEAILRIQNMGIQQTIQITFIFESSKNKFQQMKSIQIVIVLLVLLNSQVLATRSRYFHNNHHIESQQNSQHSNKNIDEASLSVGQALKSPSQISSSLSTSEATQQSANPPPFKIVQEGTPTVDLDISNVPVVTTGQLILNLTDLPKAEPEPMNDRLNWSRLAIQKIEKEIINNLRLFPRKEKEEPVAPRQEEKQEKPKQEETPSDHQKYVSNLQANNWISESYFKHQWKYISNLKNSHFIRCSIQKPFFDGEQCISCPNQYFNMDTLKCQPSPNSLTFDPNTHTFVTPTPDFCTDLSAPRLDFGGRTKHEIQQQIHPNKHQICPHKKPYFDGLICIDCLEPYTVFNLQSKRCTRCADNEEYSKNGCYEVGEKGDAWTLPKSLSNIFTSV